MIISKSGSITKSNKGFTVPAKTPKSEIKSNKGRAVIYGKEKI
jgi:hypothetical protein